MAKIVLHGRGEVPICRRVSYENQILRARPIGHAKEGTTVLKHQSQPKRLARIWSMFGITFRRNRIDRDWCGPPLCGCMKVRRYRMNCGS